MPAALRYYTPALERLLASQGAQTVGSAGSSSRDGSSSSSSGSRRRVAGIGGKVIGGSSRIGSVQRGSSLSPLPAHCYSFDRGAVHFLILDSEMPSDPDSEQGRCAEGGRGGWRGEDGEATCQVTAGQVRTGEGAGREGQAGRGRQAGAGAVGERLKERGGVKGRAVGAGRAGAGNRWSGDFFLVLSPTLPLGLLPLTWHPMTVSSPCCLPLPHLPKYIASDLASADCQPPPLLPLLSPSPPTCLGLLLLTLHPLTPPPLSAT